MTFSQNFKCRFSFHNWTMWKIIEEYRNEQKGVHKIQQARTCNCCGYTQLNCQTER